MNLQASIFCLLLGLAPAIVRADVMPSAEKLSVTDYSSIQAAIDANPGKMLWVPPGDYEVSKAITITKDGSGLFGYGRIIATDPGEYGILVTKAKNVRIYDLTLTRPDDRNGGKSLLRAEQSPNVALKGLKVLENRSVTGAGALNVTECDAAVVRDCLVRNYVAVSIEDRTADKDAGYAYKSLDGTGLAEVRCVGMLMTGNRIIEEEYPFTPETQKKYDLGRFIKKNPVKGVLVSQEWWDKGMATNWMQGSSVLINGSEDSDYILAYGNYIENGAQAFDVQSDHTTLANNITVNAMLGMKAMHGSRNIIVLGNQFSRADINGVLLQPGTASHAAGTPSSPNQKMDANVDGGSIVAHNIVSDFGMGPTHWIWGPNRWPFEFSRGQMPDDPALKDVIVQGNLLYDTGRDGLMIDGKPQVVPPTYASAVWVNPDEAQGKGPVNIKFHDNIFNPGRNGVFLPADYKP